MNEDELFPSTDHPDDPPGQERTEEEVKEGLAEVAQEVADFVEAGEPARGVFYVEEDGDYILAENIGQAVEIWREYYVDNSDAENPVKVETICDPVDLIQIGDVQEQAE